MRRRHALALGGLIPFAAQALKGPKVLDARAYPRMTSVIAISIGATPLASLLTIGSP